jgi:hypothetical protein
MLTKLLGRIARSIPLSVYPFLVRREVIAFFYHAVSAGKMEHVRNLYPVMPVTEFESALRYFQAHYNFISSAQLHAHYREGAPLPPRGSIVGAGDVAVCEECPLEKSEKSITRFYRPQEITPEPDVCLLEQGIICMGPATRSGCGALCPQVGMGCRGCYGPLPGVADQGGKMLSALASVIGAGEAGMEEHEIERQIEAAVGTIPDPAGTFYRFSMAHSLLRRAKVEEGG